MSKRNIFIGILACSLIIYTSIKTKIGPCSQQLEDLLNNK